MTARKKSRHCKACGAPALTMVRATVVRSEAPPRIGLVCKHCARCGVLVVPAALKILPARPRKVPRGSLTRALAGLREGIDAFDVANGEPE
jgi:hypothetical protein